MNRFGLLIFVFVTTALRLCAQTDTLSNDQLLYIEPYETVIYPGMAGMGHTVSTYFRVSPKEDQHFSRMQKNDLVFELDTFLFEKQHWYILLVNEYFDTHHKRIESEMSILDNAMVKWRSAPSFIDENGCEKCLLIEIRTTGEAGLKHLTFENLRRFSIRTQ